MGHPTLLAGDDDPEARRVRLRLLRHQKRDSYVLLNTPRARLTPYARYLTNAKSNANGFSYVSKNIRIMDICICVIAEHGFISRFSAGI